MTLAVPRLLPTLIMSVPFAIMGLSLALAETAAVPEQGFCIVNASDARHVFTTETREGVRQVAELAPGGRLCAMGTEAPDGIIGVFESFDALEGCARIVKRGEMDELIEYAEFDRCRWGSHGS